MKCECCGQVIIESSTANLDEMLEYLNTKTGKKFRPVESNRKFIRARIAEGHTTEDIKAVVDRMVAQWLGDPTMAQYLRPATLFNAEKFNQYVGELDAPLPEKDTEKNRWPKNDIEWVALGQKHGVSTRAGEGWPEFKVRVKRKVSNE